MDLDFNPSYITPLYAALLGLLLVYLSHRVVSLRNKFQIRMGDGGHAELTAAVRSQDGLIEYLPTALLILLMVELLGFSPIVVHLLGVWLVAARLLHLKGQREPSGASRLRRLGTRLTWGQMTAACLLGLAGFFGMTF